MSTFERDRRAILAMAGDYRVTFDFLEVASFRADASRERPYQSWGTERVYVDRDEGRFISLVHIMEMRVIQKDGSTSAPLVQKHWRQDWWYEPIGVTEYRGHDRWQVRLLSTSEHKGRWSQTVDQVDESPRYASVGRWQHSGSFSSWISGETWRPLPRRELGARKDYQLLLGTNRVTVIPTGWLQEENNLKTILSRSGAIDTSTPYLSREYGVARYERLKDADFAAANQYYERTREFWSRVHAEWGRVYWRDTPVIRHQPLGADGLDSTLADYADQLAAGESPASPAEVVIYRAVASTALQ